MADDRIELGSAEVPQVLYELARTLPQCESGDLENRLQTFDTFLEILAEDARPQLAKILLAASENSAIATRLRLIAAAEAVMAGERITLRSTHAQDMERYQAAHREAFTTLGRECAVDSETFRAFVSEHRLVLEAATAKPGGIGETERWFDASGSLRARVFVRYWKGEHEVDYFVIDPPE